MSLRRRVGRTMPPARPGSKSAPLLRQGDRYCPGGTISRASISFAPYSAITKGWKTPVGGSPPKGALDQSLTLQEQNLAISLLARYLSLMKSVIDDMGHRATRCDFFGVNRSLIVRGDFRAPHVMEPTDDSEYRCRKTEPGVTDRVFFLQLYFRILDHDWVVRSVPRIVIQSRPQ